jgi:hypothetical protein
MRRRVLIALGPVLLLASSATPPARAGEREACEAAFEQAQTFRDARKLIAAREQLRLCARAECPVRMAQDCTTWVAEIEPRIPSVVVVATDRAGAVLTDGVGVSVDHAAARNVDGTAWDIDPGPHTFTWVAADGTKAEKPFLVLEGQKAQRVTVSLTSNRAAGLGAPAPSAGSAATTQGLGSDGHGQRVLAFLTGSVGLAGVVVGGVFGGLTFSAASAVNTDCPGHVSCPANALSEHRDAVTFGTVSDIGFIAGGVLLATGLTLYFTAPKDAAPKVGLEIAPSGLGLTGSF